MARPLQIPYRRLCTVAGGWCADLVISPRRIVKSAHQPPDITHSEQCAKNIFWSSASSAVHICRCTISGALCGVTHQDRCVTVFLANRLLFYLFFKKYLYTYICKYMCHLIKRLCLICQSFRDVKGEKRSNNNKNMQKNITWFTYGRQERGREMHSLALLQQRCRGS